MKGTEAIGLTVLIELSEIPAMLHTTSHVNPVNRPLRSDHSTTGLSAVTSYPSITYYIIYRHIISSTVELISFVPMYFVEAGLLKCHSNSALDNLMNVFQKVLFAMWQTKTQRSLDSLARKFYCVVFHGLY